MSTNTYLARVANSQEDLQGWIKHYAELGYSYMVKNELELWIVTDNNVVISLAVNNRNGRVYPTGSK